MATAEQRHRRGGPCVRADADAPAPRGWPVQFPVMRTLPHLSRGLSWPFGRPETPPRRSAGTLSLPPASPARPSPSRVLTSGRLTSARAPLPARLAGPRAPQGCAEPQRCAHRPRRPRHLERALRHLSLIHI
eukprot:1207224-Prymnesium_polylepis.1